MKFTTSLALVLFAACVDTSSTEGEGGSTEDGTVLTDNAPEVHAIAVPKVELARLTAPHGELTFFSIPAHGHVALREISRPGSGGELVELSDAAGPLATFLALTAPTTPVPRALVEASDNDDLKRRALQRGLVETLPGSIPVIGVAIASIGGGTSSASDAQMCNEGLTSGSFLEEVCPMTNWDVDFCHNGTWHSVTDTVSWENRRRDSLSRTLACEANGHVRHQYKFGGVWYSPIDEDIPSGQRHRWDLDGNSALSRRITHSRTASGFVRGASHFNVPF